MAVMTTHGFLPSVRSSMYCAFALIKEKSAQVIQKAAAVALPVASYLAVDGYLASLTQRHITKTPGSILISEPQLIGNSGLVIANEVITAAATAAVGYGTFRLARKYCDSAVSKISSFLSDSVNSYFPAKEKSFKESRWVQAARGAALLPLFVAGRLGAVGVNATSALVDLYNTRCVPNLSFSYPEPLLSHLKSKQPFDPFTQPSPYVDTVFGEAVVMSGTGALVAVAEEVLFRAGMQDLLLKQVPSYLAGKYSARFSNWIENGSVAKALRIGLSALAFSAAHASHQDPFTSAAYSSEQVMFRLTNTFIGGLIMGALQETTGRIWAPIGLHVANNTIQIFRDRTRYC